MTFLPQASRLNGLTDEERKALDEWHRTGPHPVSQEALDWALAQKPLIDAERERLSRRVSRASLSPPSAAGHRTPSRR